jgi:8-oxo-dGTP diphosphatase
MTRPVTPLLATDVIIELIDRVGSPIVLIERKNPPHGWALPGGFVEVGETLEHAAVREAQEETGLHVALKTLLGCYSDPGRDERGHTVSVVYIGQATGEPEARDDAANVDLFLPSSLPDKLAFDHVRILWDYLTYRRSGKVPAPAPPE